MTEKIQHVKNKLNHENIPHNH